MPQTKADEYVRRIRNKNKRAYAQDYLNFCAKKIAMKEDYPLSYMAKQAVRMEINRLLNPQ